MRYKNFKYTASANIFTYISINMYLHYQWLPVVYLEHPKKLCQHNILCAQLIIVHTT